RSSALRRLAKGGVLCLTLGLGLWGMAQNPFAQPLIERAPEAAARSLEHAFRNTFTPDWVAAEIDAALAGKNEARALWLADLAAEEGVTIPPDTATEIARIRAEAEDWGERTLTCLSC